MGIIPIKNAEQRFPVNTRPPRIAELVMQAVGNQFTVKATTDGRMRDVSPFVTASLGAATFFLEHYDNVSLSSLLDCADEVLYHAKRSGRNRCSYSVSSISKA